MPGPGGALPILSNGDDRDASQPAASRTRNNLNLKLKPCLTQAASGPTQVGALAAWPELAAGHWHGHSLAASGWRCRRCFGPLPLLCRRCFRPWPDSEPAVQTGPGPGHWQKTSVNLIVVVTCQPE
jgi:hypothetical protein